MTDTGKNKSQEIPSWVIPTIAALAAGAGAYGLARHQFKGPKGSALRQIREMSGGKMYRGDAAAIEPPKGLLSRLLRPLKWGPERDAMSSEGARELAKEFKDKVPAAVWQRDYAPVSGTFNPALGPMKKGPGASSQASLIESMTDKLKEYQVLEKHAPGTMARTLDVKEVARKHGIPTGSGGKISPEHLGRLQDALKSEFKDTGFVLKTRSGSTALDANTASSGMFPTDRTSLSDAYSSWKKMRPEFESAAKKEDLIDKVVAKFRKKPGYEGRVVEEMLNGNAIVQEKLKLKGFNPITAAAMKSKGHGATREFRIHVVGGKAIPYMATPRYPGFSPEMVVDTAQAQHAARWAQKNVLDKLPIAQRGVSMGMDVAPVKGGGYKVIEMNTGGSSGLLDTVPGMSHLLHKAVTGRFSRSAAGILAGAAGVAGAGAAVAGQKAIKSSSDKE